MGFFSKIKGLLGRKDVPAEPAAAPVEQIERPEQPAPAPAAPVQVAPVQEAPVQEAPPQAAPISPEAPPAGLDRDALILALRGAEPRLSAWLAIVLQGVEGAGDLLWERLAFLLEALEAPKNEADDFIQRFRKWLADMDYSRVEEFRSELQYRLALALDMEDEEDERNRLFLKLSEGLAKTREALSSRVDALLSSSGAIDEAFWEELEEILIAGDVGMDTVAKLLDGVRKRVRETGTTERGQVRELLRAETLAVFKTARRIAAVNPPETILIIGVNGVGKTTTIAKLAYRARMQGRRTLIAAGDTFRAAAMEQLSVWATRTGADFYAKGEAADPAAVAFEAMDKAVAERHDILIVDTAGRLHTKTNLMEELQKIKRVLGKKHPGAPHRTILVLDSTTGQNALSQAKLFHEGVGVDEIILTKLDGTAKGGAVVTLADRMALPITFIGLGEKMEDLRPFHPEDFAKALIG